MTVANIGSQIYAGLSQVCGTVGRVYGTLSKDVTNIETAILFAKVGDVYLSAQKALGGGANSSQKAFQEAFGYLDGWNALMTFPDTVNQTAEKISTLFKNQTGRAAFDCAEGVSGLYNASCEVVGFLGNQLASPFFKGISDATETSNFQVLAGGSFARIAMAAERILNEGLGAGFKNVIDVIKNLGDFVFAGIKLTGGSELALVSATAVSTTCKVATYYFSKTI